MRRIAVLVLACAAFCGSASATIITQTTGSVGDPLYSIAYGWNSVFAKAVANAPGEVFGSAELQDGWTIGVPADGPGDLYVQVHFYLEGRQDESLATLNIGGQEVRLQSTGEPYTEVFQTLVIPFVAGVRVPVNLYTYAHASADASQPSASSSALISIDGILAWNESLGSRYYYAYSTDSGNSYQFNNGGLIPEPASAALAIPALAGLWLLRRKYDRRGTRNGR